MTQKTKSFEDLLREVDEEYRVQDELDEELSNESFSCDFPVADTVDNEILMHRDVHFSGSFVHMLNYYEKGSKGIDTAISTGRIKYLQQLEKEGNNNLSAQFLSAWEIEKVARGKELYKDLREVSESDTEEARIPKLIANLIFSEDEEPVAEIEAIVNEGELASSFLCDLLRSDIFSDALSPGYGLAPHHAAQCLGKIASPDAIRALFESIGRSDFHTESCVNDALAAIGEEAEKFLQKILVSQPITNDNEKAATALSRFAPNEKTAQLALSQIQNPDLRKQNILASHLVFLCEGLRQEDDREQFQGLLKEPGIDEMVLADMRCVITLWK